jgi:hypothetical protein
MSECDRLLPPAQTLHERLTRNQRERRLLRTLLRLVMREETDSARQTASEPRQTAAGREDER